ncbi:hypothetical protein D3C78_19480 [compost metagenome]
MTNLAVCSVSQDRMSNKYDGVAITEVKDAKIVDRFVTTDGNDLNYVLTGVLVKVKCKGGIAFWVVADLDEDTWFVTLPSLNTSDEEIMIAQDHISHALKGINIGRKTTIRFEEGEQQA